MLILLPRIDCLPRFVLVLAVKINAWRIVLEDPLRPSNKIDAVVWMRGGNRMLYRIVSPLAVLISEVFISPVTYFSAHSRIARLQVLFSINIQAALRSAH